MESTPTTLEEKVTFEQDRPGGIVWIPKGSTFTSEDLVFYRDKEQRSLE
jgi:hypothetical protein